MTLKEKLVLFHGNSNHLAHDCRKNKKDLKSVIKSKFSDSTAKIRIKPCSHCGSIIHSQNACKILHNVYARRNGMSSYLNKHSSQNKLLTQTLLKCLLLHVLIMLRNSNKFGFLKLTELMRTDPSKFGSSKFLISCVCEIAGKHERSSKFWTVDVQDT